MRSVCTQLPPVPLAMCAGAHSPILTARATFTRNIHRVVGHLVAAAIYPWAKCADIDESRWYAIHEAATETIMASYAAQAATAAAGVALSATRGTFTAMAPTFTLSVYRRTLAPDGAAVLSDEGPHGRSIFWVQGRQVAGKSDT